MPFFALGLTEGLRLVGVHALHDRFLEFHRELVFRS